MSKKLSLICPEEGPAGDARLLRIEKWPSLADSGESFFGGGGQSVLVRENAQRDRTLVVVGRYENVQLLSTSRRMGVPNTWNRCLFYLPMWSMHLSLLWDAYIVAKMSLILSEVV